MHQRLSLDHLTVFDAPPPEIVSIADELGCEAISLFIQKPNDRVSVPDLIDDRALRRETARRLAHTDVQLNAVECFIVTPESDIAAFRPALEVGAELGGRYAAAVVFGDDLDRLAERYAAFCRAAAEFGLGVNLEFLAISPVSSAPKAEAFLGRVGERNAGILADPLHVVRGGSQPGELALVAPGLLRAAQICDGPLSLSPEAQESEGLEQRRLPGEGEFPLKDFLAALPRDITIGVEVPLRDLRELGVPPRERARRAVTATRRLLEARDRA